jgi:3-methylfumaryl-CoA hydratase
MLEFTLFSSCRDFMTSSLEDLRQWIGRKEIHTDTATAWPVAALSATLDRPDPEPAIGTQIPPGWHWLYFLETTPGSKLARDGHPERGGFLPPVELPRRMWAGGRIDFCSPLRIGDSLLRESEIVSVEPKQGKSGSLVFVTVRHTIRSPGTIAVVEEHDIVYREAAKPGDRSPAGEAAPQDAPWRRALTADAVLLFRFSALIFNAHRIHYDIDYCREEGYPGLIVHGPLQTILALDLCRRNDPRPVRRLDYRARLPVYHGEPFTVNGDPDANGQSVTLWIANAAGSYAMTATATF